MDIGSFISASRPIVRGIPDPFFHVVFWAPILALNVPLYLSTSKSKVLLDSSLRREYLGLYKV